MPKFKKGNPGGPGRPRGSRNAVNVILDQLAADGAQDMVKKMIEVAAAGDRVAARLVLSRIWSAPKGRALEIALPEIKTPADLVEAHAVLASAITDQRLSPQEGAAIATVLESHRRAFELVVQEARVQKLEEELPRLKKNLTG